MLRRSLKDDELQDFAGLLNELGSISITNGEDQRIWSINPSGVFTVSSVSKLNTSSSMPNNLFAALWKSKSPRKVNVFFLGESSWEAIIFSFTVLSGIKDGILCLVSSKSTGFLTFRLKPIWFKYSPDLHTYPLRLGFYGSTL